MVMDNNGTAASAIQASGLEFWAALVIVVFMAALAGTIIFRILQGPERGIDLSKLLSEKDGDASMSRFQLLVFTFVIAMGLLVSVLKTGQFPTLNAEILGLLGISAGSYVGAKITQKAAEARQANGG
jgi:hypothetical protein